MFSMSFAVGCLWSFPDLWFFTSSQNNIILKNSRISRFLFREDLYSQNPLKRVQDLAYLTSRRPPTIYLNIENKIKEEDETDLVNLDKLQEILNFKKIILKKNKKIFQDCDQKYLFLFFDCLKYFCFILLSTLDWWGWCNLKPPKRL